MKIEKKESEILIWTLTGNAKMLLVLQQNSLKTSDSRDVNEKLITLYWTTCTSSEYPTGMQTLQTHLNVMNKAHTYSKLCS